MRIFKSNYFSLLKSIWISFLQFTAENQDPDDEALNNDNLDQLISEPIAGNDEKDHEDAGISAQTDLTMDELIAMFDKISISDKLIKTLQKQIAKLTSPEELYVKLWNI